MKKFFIFLLLFLLGGILLVQGIKEKIKHDLSQPVILPSSVATPAPSVKHIADAQVRTSLFVPYWTVSSQLKEEKAYDAFIYFGVLPGASGIAAAEPGIQDVGTFLASLPADTNPLLTLRMLDSTQNSAILSDGDRQRQLVASTITFAQQQGFDGIILDLEMSAIPFDSLVDQISDFTLLFVKQAKASGLSFGVTSYGDTFYRLRPFDMKVIGREADEVLIMAYDFHKARGNPGPNFPLQGKETYGYDLEQMLLDYRAVMPVDKITVIFGMFGYDWLVDDEGKSLSQGKAVTWHEVQQKFLNGCTYSQCVTSRDSISSETKVTYIDAEGGKHIVWFEDEQSIAQKQQFFKQHGVSSFSFWAYSYF